MYQSSVDLLDSTGGSELDNHRTDIIRSSLCNSLQVQNFERDEIDIIKIDNIEIDNI